MALPLGIRLGVYEVTAQIGEGGMGQVYRGTDTTLGRQVAIKVLPDAFAADPERLARFEREAKTLASLNHPNIAAIYGFERSGGMHALVMELVDGDDLSQRIARGAIPIDEALPIAKQIAAALESAHEQGIIHRDLKPANIKVRGDGTVKVLDFGLAKAMEPIGAMSASASMSPTITTPAMTQMGMILGTAAYMSPEQAKGQQADRRSDVWSFGAVLFEMLTGQRAFDGEDIADVLAAVLQRDVTWTLLPPTTPAHVEGLLRRCLERDRRKRLRDIGDALLELEGHFQPAATRTPASTDSVGWIGTAVVAAVSLFAGAGAMALWPATPEPADVLRLEVTVPDGWRVPIAAPRVGRANAADSAIAISRDGRQLAFVGTRDGRSTLWVRPLDGVAAQNIEGTQGASSPFWSPDGSALAFFASGKLKKLVLATRELVTLCDVENPRGGTWSSRGVIVFGDMNRPIQRVSENGGIPAPATNLRQGEVAHNRPAFLPDDLRFAYRAVLNTAGAGPIYVASIDGGEEAKALDSEIANVQFSSGRILFVRGGAILSQPFNADTLTLSGEPTILAAQVQLTGIPNIGQFSVSRQGTLVYRANESPASLNGLGWLALDGSGWTEVGDRAPYGHVDLSNDGMRAALAINDPGRDTPRRMWLFDLVRTTRTRVTTDDVYQEAPAWSPDGRLLAFLQGAGSGGKRSVMLVPGDGSTPPRKLNEIEGSLGWTADGRALLVTTRATGSRGSLDIMQLPIDRPGVLEPVVASPFDEAMPQVSRDGRWLAYRSNESGVDEVYVMRFRGSGPRIVISKGGGTTPRWGRDSRELFYAVPESADVSTRPGSIVRVRMQLVADGIQPGVAERVPDSPTVVPANNGWSYAVSADGRRLLAIVPPSGGTTPIMVVKNWESLAR